MLVQWLGCVGLILSISVSTGNDGLLIPLLAVLRLLVVDGMVVLVHDIDESEVCPERLHMWEYKSRIKGVRNVKRL